MVAILFTQKHLEFSKFYMKSSLEKTDFTPSFWFLLWTEMHILS